DQTRRFFGGRQPLCGIGVTSRIERTCSPAAASAWIADSRPLPGPCRRTCTRFMPSCTASRPACSAATVAANGVDFFDPLKPALPALPHATTFPCRSVIVIRVLLNVALMWAMPSASTLLRLLFVRAPFFGFAMRRVPLCCPYLGSRYPAARRPIRQSGRPSLRPGRQAGAGAGRLLPRRLLLARDRAARTLVRARIRVRALTAHRQATAVP